MAKHKAAAQTGMFVPPTYTIPEILRYNPDPKDFIVGNGWVERGGCTLVAGATGMGKSVLVEQMAIAMATGKPLFGKIAVRNKSRVVYIQAENNLRVLHEDIPSIMAHLGVKSAELKDKLFITHAYGMMGDDFFVMLEDQIRRYEPDVLIADPFQSFVEGNLNDSNTMRGFTNIFEPMMKKCNSGSLLVTHFNKPASTDLSGYDPRELIYASAGSAHLMNWARAGCELLHMKSDVRRFRLHFSKNPKLTGLVAKDGYILRDLYIEHSLDINNPYWALSKDQASDVKVTKRTSSKKDAEAETRELFVKFPKMSARLAAEKMGIGKTLAAKIKKELKEGGEI